ncbi:MAG: DUF5711 family protein [Clostridia bacterium]
MKNKAIKKKKEVITKLILVIISLTLIAIAMFIVFMLIDENGYFSDEEANSGSVMDTNSISLSYLDENSVFTFPLSFSDKDLVSVQILGTNVCILTSKTLICLNEDGEFLFYEELNYSSPVLVTSENLGIVYDEVGGEYITFNENKVVYESQIADDETFLLAKVDDDENTLLVTKSETQSSIFYLYDSKNELVRNFGFSQDYVVGVSIYDSDKIVFLTIGSQDGYFNSMIYLFDMQSDTELSSYSLSSSYVVSVDFIDKNTFNIVTSDELILAQINDSDQIVISSQVSIQGELLNYNISQMGIIVATQPIDELNETQISLYNDDLILNCMMSIPYKALDIYADSKYIYVLTSSLLYIFNSSGEINSQISISDSAFEVVSSSSGVYYYSVGVLHKNNYKLST